MQATEFISALRGSLRRTLVLDGISRIIGWGLLGAAACILLDRFNSLPGPVRLVLLVGLAVAVATVAWRRLIRPIGLSLDDTSVARIAERRIRELDGRLFSTIEGIPLSDRDRQTLEGLCTEERARELIRSDGMVRALSGASLLLTAFLGVAALYPGTFMVGVQRLLMPLGSAQWDPDHVLRASLERPVVAADQPLVVVADGLEGDATPLRIRWERADGSGDQRVPDAMAGPWRERLALTPGTYRIELRWGDAVPVELTGRVVERPGLRSMTATLEPPAYTGRDAQDLTSLANLAVLPGSRLVFDLRSGSAPDGAERSVSASFQGRPVELASQPDTGHTRGTLAVDAAGELVIDLHDRYQDADTEEPVVVPARPEPRIPVSIIDDRVPHVRLSGPRRNEAVSPQAEIDLLVHAQDDIALASLVLEAAVDGGEAGDGSGEVLAEWPGIAGTQGETQRRHRITVSELAGPGSVIILTAEAADANDVTGPGIGRSDPLPLRVVSEAELRQELDRTLSEVRDRIIQARDQLAPGLTDAERLRSAARAARPVAERAAEQLRETIRRWEENDLGDGMEDLEAAVDAVESEAVPRLKEAPHEGDLAEANQADRKLGEAERTIARMLQSGDLARELRNLINRQQQINQASRAFVKANLAGVLDETGQRQQADLALRQQELGDQLREWQRRLLDNQAEALDPARDVVRTRQPASGLDEAARILRGDEGRQRALAEQGAATSTMQELLELLVGSENAQELADMAGELAARQEDLAARLAAGERPQDLRDEQKRLEEETRQLHERVENETENQEAGESLEGANQSQAQAGEAMEGGQSSQAQREAAAAAAQLRQAQRELGGQDEGEQGEQGEQEEQDAATDIVALLRRLKEQQTKIVTRTTKLVTEGVGVDGAELGFADKRKIAAVADLELEVQLQLKADALGELDQMPIALRALQRVERAVTKAYEHLDEPALGRRAERLTKIALFEIERLLRIVDTMPSPEQQKQGQGGGEGGSQAPFPPAAQIALLAAEQLELRLATSANRPIDLAEAQNRLRELAETAAGATRPGTRPHVLMQRAVRAMASAGDLLDHQDRGATTRSEQDTAVAMLFRLLAEAEGSGGGGGGSSSGAQRPQGGQQGGRSQQRQSDRGDQGDGQRDGQEGQQGQAQGGNPAGGSPGEGTEGSDTVVVEVEEQRWMHLPKAEREKLKEALHDQVPPEGLELFRAYLEVLEGYSP